jgi:Cu+-exporting ATPase
MGSANFLRRQLNSNDASHVHLQIDGGYRGCFVVKSSYREGLKELLNELKTNQKIYLLSGDNETDKDVLAQWFDLKNMHFNQTPRQKLDFIEQLKASGECVMMIGDGLNDAGALKAATIGVAITDDIYNFTPSSDAILSAKQFKSLLQFLIFSKQTLAVVRVSFIISLTYNIVGLSFAVQGVLSPLVAAILMPLSSITVVIFITVVINYLSIKALGK